MDENACLWTVSARPPASTAILGVVHRDQVVIHSRPQYLWKNVPRSANDALSTGLPGVTAGQFPHLWTTLGMDAFSVVAVV